MRRRIIVPIDALVEIIKDYTADTHDIPFDAMPVSLQINPTERGMFGIVVQSDQFRDDSPIPVHFDIKRVFTI